MTARLVTPAAYQVASYRLEHEDHDAWLALRREGIGGSDAPAIMDLDGYRTAWQVWLDKTGAAPAEEGRTEAEAEWLEWGHEMEPVIARIWHRRMGGRGRVARCGMLARADAPHLRVNLDRRCLGVCDDGPCLLEVKNRSAWQARQWSVDGDPDRVPDGPHMQVQHALMVTGYSHGHLVAAVGGHSLRPYRVGADPVLHKLLAEEETWFWRAHVLAGVPPPIDATERTGRILARMWDADPALVFTAGPDQVRLVEEHRSAQIAIKYMQGKQAEREHQLQQWLGEAEVAVDAAGQPLFTWKRNGTFRGKDFARDWPQVAAGYERPAVRYDTAGLADADPELYRQYRARVFRVKAARGDGEENR